MGYRSDVVIAISKTIATQDLLTQTIPKCVHKLEKSIKDVGIFYFIEGWKWSDVYPDVDEIINWFDSMDSNQFGARRLGEEPSDTEEWGSPEDFDIYIRTYIEYPD